MTSVEQLLSSVEHYDEIVGLVDQLEATPPEQPTTIHSLSSEIVQFFGELAKNGEFSLEGSPKQIKTAGWLAERLDEFGQVIAKFLSTDNETTAVTAFAVSLKVLLILGKYVHKDTQAFFTEILYRSLHSKSAIFSLWEDYMKYDDLRFYFLRYLGDVVDEKKEPARQSERILEILLSLEDLPQSDEALRKFYLGKPKFSKSAMKTGKGSPLKISSQKNSFQRAWLATFKLPLNTTQIKAILSVLHTRVIPNMQKPQLLMDFLTDAYNYGGSLALLALNGLFSLIQNYNLDYPNFYTQLYSLLDDGSILVSSHRARFFRLLDLFLSSSHLPATIPASVMKRLARLSLFAPPGALIAIIPFIYNQLKRHPTCMLMIHRETDVRGADADPFDASQPDPLLTRAIESSLWEIDTLTRHYQPNIASLAKIISQPFHKPNYQLEHFLVHSYDTLYNTEARRTGEIPTLEFEEVDMYNGVMDAWTI